MPDWSNLEDRLKVWEFVKNHDGDDELNKKTSNMFEVMTVLSALCCGSLISLSESKNKIDTVLFVYDIIRGYGIISSVFCSVISITLCSLLNATSNRNTFSFVEHFMKFSNIPFFGIIFSLSCLVICSSLYFDGIVMYITLPFSIFVISYCLYFYGDLHNFIYDVIHQDDTVDN